MTRIEQEAHEHPLTRALVEMGGRVTKVVCDTIQTGVDAMSFGGKEKKDIEEVAGLWVQTSKSGLKYFRGKAEDGTVYLIFKNENRKSDKAPEYRLVKQIPEGAAAAAPKTQQADSDLPF